jgi:hypothetical protein
LINQTATAAAVVALCVLQGVAAAQLVVGRPRGALWASLLCPLGVLAVCFSRMSLDDSISTLRSLRPLELLFLAANLAIAVAATGLLSRDAGAATAPLWGLWTVNCATCTVMIYLTFFFSLF